MNHKKAKTAYKLGKMDNKLGKITYIFGKKHLQTREVNPKNS
ncbi:hypothetical protein SAMN04487826_2678 [Prevotella sp. khp1]|nr:hypothetical protein SAMN04487826_2678 [Prevotella sp. khp1]